MYPSSSVVVAPVSACASGAMASMLLPQGDVDVVGGVDSTVCNNGLGGFSVLRALSTNSTPDQASRPRARRRDSFVVAKGVGVIVVEALSQAQQRETTVQCGFCGYGMTSGGCYFTTPDRSAEQSILTKHLALG